MRKIALVFAFVFSALSVLFSILPMGTIGLIPVGLGLFFSGLAWVKSAPAQKKVPVILFLISSAILLFIVARSFIPDEVAPDKQFEQRKEINKKQDLEDLENL
jgi:membrane protein implicated in regulation of membrane protease activity